MIVLKKCDLKTGVNDLIKRFNSPSDAFLELESISKLFSNVRWFENGFDVIVEGDAIVRYQICLG